MIEPVPIGDQRVGHGAQIEELVPVGVVAGEAGDLDPEDDPHLPETDVGDESLEALPGGRLGARTTEVLVDDDDLARLPAEIHGAVGELVLALEALGVLADLREGRLAHVDIGVAAEVARRQLGQQVTHRSPPCRAPRGR